MGEIETVEAEKMGWLDLPRGTSYPTFPYSCISNFYPGSLKFEVSMTFGSWAVTLFSRSCRGHIFISSHTVIYVPNYLVYP